jgi:nitroreductase
MFGLIMAQDDSVIKLPAPQLKGGKLLMQALKERQSIRSYSAKPLPLQTLSDLLWAADGINRPESGKRTAPTAMNQQELDIYVVLADGVYLYEPKEHALQSVVKGDFRKLCGKQDFVAGAPVNLILIADFKKWVIWMTRKRGILRPSTPAILVRMLFILCLGRFGWGSPGKCRSGSSC